MDSLMGPQTVAQFTFDDATREINYNDRALALAISNQANAGDQSAHELADLYRKGARLGGEAPEVAHAARVEFMARYNDWRNRFPDLVAPIAAALGHPAPGAVVGAVTPASTVADMFAGASTAVSVLPEAAAAPPAAPTPPPTAEAPLVPGNGTPRRAAPGKKRSWSQPDVVALTRIFAAVLGPEWTPQARAQEFITKVRDDFSAEEVLTKAAEFGLVDASAVPGKSYEASDADKRVLRSRLLTQIVPENVTNEAARLALYKAALVELREIVKSMTADSGGGDETATT